MWPDVHKRSSLDPPANIEDVRVIVPARSSQPGIAAFTAAFAGLGPVRPLLVGGDGIAIERFLLEPADRWVRP